LDQIPDLFRNFAPWHLALIPDALMREAMHQGLQIGVQFLRFLQVILRAPEKCGNLRARSRRHGFDSVSAMLPRATQVKYRSLRSRCV
jgi:hypothetical protein